MKNKELFLIIGIFSGYIVLLIILYKFNPEIVLPVALFLSFFGLISLLVVHKNKKS